jgi:enterochelin esterase-like enzyme
MPASAQWETPHYTLCTDDPDALICELEPEWDIASIQESIKDQNPLIWDSGNELYIVVAVRADELFLNGGIQTGMRPLTTDNDLWGIALRIQDLSQAVIGYGFIPISNGVWNFTGQEFTVWRGPDAPEAPVYRQGIYGTLHTFKYNSENLGSIRQVTVYLPPDHDKSQVRPVLYMADGQSLDHMAHYIDPLIVDGTLPPLIMVGLYAADSKDATSTDDDPRGAEYLIIAGDERFEAHEAFLLDEILPWAEDTFGASTEASQRAVFGYSNGAAFAITMGQRHPDLFGNVIAFSVAGSESDIPGAQSDPVGRYYLQAGTLEPPFHKMTVSWFDKLTDQGAEVEFVERVGGHDSTIWNESITTALKWVFAPGEEQRVGLVNEQLLVVRG